MTDQTGEQGHILVVDDNRTNRLALSLSLERQAHTVALAQNGRQALEMLQTQSFDLVLLDIMMPEMDGYQVLERMKADSALREIPVIVISALDDMQSVVKCISLGAEDYLPKPFDPTLLKARIGASLEKKRLRDQEVEYLRHVTRLTNAAAAIETETFDPDSLADVANRPDALGQLARVFQNMAREVYAREQRLKQAAQDREEKLKKQLMNLRIELDTINPMLHEAFDLTPPFDFLTFQEKEWLAGRAEPFSYPDGWAISSPDDDDYDLLYLLLEGRVALQEDNADQSGQRTIECPAFFGERSVFFDQPPTARFVAEGRVRCAALAGADIRSLIGANSMFSQAFATALRNKQRIFHGYDAFVNLIFTQIDEGVVQLRDLVEAYRGLNSILHQASGRNELDLDALAYVIPRLPEKITSALALFLAEELPAMYRPVREAIRAPSRRARKREFYEILPNKILVLLRDRTTDTVDLITKLCIYAVETGKIRERLSDTSLTARLARFAIYGGPAEAAESTIAALPFTTEEMTCLRDIFGRNLLQKLYEILVQVGDMAIYVRQGDHRYTKSSSELWLSQIRTGLGQVITPEAFNGDLDVHIISSNTHSVHNCLSSWLHERAETICAWAAAALPEQLNLLKPADRLYAAVRAWSEAHPDEAAHRAASDLDHGLHRLDDASFTGIEVSLIDANRLAAPLDPDIGRPALRGRTLIVNIDYAYGQQAELIMRSLILLFGRRIRSISIFGKSGAIVGQRGDLLLPDQLLLQTDDHLYPIPNRDLTADDFQAAGWDRPLHQGTLLTVLGTTMQNREMLLYYRHFWQAIGMEMEGSFYLREIRRARSLGLIPEDVRLRFAYYTSDTPLEANASLASNLSATEGLPPVYGITRAVLRRILVAEGG